jgi:hypothetical protein
MPGLPEPTAARPDLDPAEYAGVYERVGTRVTMRVADEGGLVAHVETSGLLADLHKPQDIPLTPFTAMTGGAAFLGRLPDDPLWIPVVFYRLSNGDRYVHLGARATPRVSD